MMSTITSAPTSPSWWSEWGRPVFRYIAFSWNPADESQSRIAERLELALRQRKCWQSAFAMAGHKVFMTGSKVGANDAYPLTGNRGVVLGKLFRRGGPPPTRRANTFLSDAEAERIVQSDGRALIEQFWGRYIAFLPSWTGQGRVLRDPTGALPCFRVGVQGVDIVLSWLDDLFELLEVPTPPVDWQAVAAHLVLGGLSGRETGLEGVTQVLAGQLTPMNAWGNQTLRLWNATEHARHASAATPAEASRLLRDTVSDCVNGWASSYESFVLRLSGGIDSSILLGTLAGGPVTHKFTCLNYYSPDVAGDERVYARLGAQRHRMMKAFGWRRS